MTPIFYYGILFYYKNRDVRKKQTLISKEFNMAILKIRKILKKLPQPTKILIREGLKKNQTGQTLAFGLTSAGSKSFWAQENYVS